MKFIPQTWQSFKFTIGIAILCAAIFYGVLVTILVLAFGDRCSGNSLVWNFLNTIISTTLGWYLAKASTVIDYVWGASHKTLPGNDQSPPAAVSINRPQLFRQGPKKNRQQDRKTDQQTEDNNSEVGN